MNLIVIIDIVDNVRSIILRNKNRDEMFFAIFYFDVSKIEVLISNFYLKKLQFSNKDIL